ncbi:MAG: efflux RND transporter permease subunit [Gemmatimonadetes bacterium]|nr:MAG: efflux RND transporter permease subunit [Gemmatimonadota bacterium]
MIRPTDGPGHGGPGGPPEDPRELARYKEFWLTSLSVRHSTSILVMLVFVVVAGFMSYASIPKESFPEIEVPFIAVNTIYPGVSPADIETLVTRPLEDELSTISDVKELTSTSVEGYSSIVAEFEASVDLEAALQKVREKVDLAKPDLPDDAEDPMIIEFDFSEVPVIQVNLSGEYGLVRLKELGEDLKDRIEQIPSVLRADLRGGLEREVQVDVDLSRLQFYNISINDVIDAVRSENVNIPGGSVDVGDFKFLVRVDGEFDDPKLIEDLVVATKGGRPIYVRDVASVDFGFAERESYARLDGSPVVTIDVIKRSGRNIIETVDEVKAAIADMQPEFPPSTVVKLTSDQSKQIENMVSSLENNIVSGLILIVAVLLFFLGTTNSLFVAVSIPTSMLLSFIVIKLSGLTMNMVVLFSLILALGMLVDNAIVVVENIYRYLEEGWDRVTAARKATGEVAMPVIAATATTLAAFAPLMLWPGQIGEFMKFLPATLIIALSSSLFVALTIVPTLCALFMRLEDGPEAGERRGLTLAARIALVGVAMLLFAVVFKANPLTAVLLGVTGVGLWLLHRHLLARVAHTFQHSVLPWNLRTYEGALRWALNHRALTIVTAVFVLFGSVIVFFIANPGIEFFPEDIPPNQIVVDAELPVGARAEATDRVARRLEAEIGEAWGIEDAESVVATVGGSGGGGNPFGGGASGPDEARILISLVDFQDRRYDASEVLRRMQASVGHDIAGAEITIDRVQDGPAQGAPVNIEIIGEDPQVLKQLSDRVLEVLRGSPVYAKLVGLESDLDEARPELAVDVDREKAALYGVSTQKVGMAIRGAIQGLEAGKFRTGEDEYDIVVRLAPEYRGALESLRDLTVMDEGTQIPLLSVADWHVQDGYGSIRRKDQERMATISSDVAEGLNSNAVLAEVQATLAAFQEQDLPPGYEMRYTGQSQEQDEAAGFLEGAFLAALMLIAMILVSQFNSVIKPAIILTSVIMSTSGVMLGLVLFRMPFGIIMTGVGIISLAGIVVNNAIVLIDYIDILRTRDGMDRREALVRGGLVRFRPVVLTAITTALGLVPLAIGLNFDFFGLYTRLDPELYWGGEQAAWWGPMAIAVIAGILFATFLTLILVPVMYSVVDDLGDWLKRAFLGSREGEAVAGPSDPGAGDAPASDTGAGHEGGAEEPGWAPGGREPAAVPREAFPGGLDPQPEGAG